jgi:hypothetical protein
VLTAEEAEALTQRVQLDGGSGCSTSWPSSAPSGTWLLGAFIGACVWRRRQSAAGKQIR